MDNEVVIYQGKNGEIKFDADISKETIWATYQQIADLFGVDRTGVVRHINNIYKIGELERDATCAKIAQVRYEGEREIERYVDIFNLDAIISVGYRINSKRATDFRIWATKTLKQHILKGYTVNQERMDQLGKMLEIVSRSEIAEVAGVADIVKKYLGALNLLQQYDDGELTDIRGKKTKWQLNSDDAMEFLQGLPFAAESSNFAKARNGSFAGIIAGLYQTFGGVELYESVEEKAANLLYQVVKDHPFFDGNKRSAAALFVYFLDRNGMLQRDGRLVVESNALAAMTLMIALSNPREKETMIKLVCNLLEVK